MTPDEVTSFEGLPHAAAAVELRRIDDRAKVAGRPTRDVDDFADLLHEVCR
jgi:predicted HD phosphohydrolase